MFRLGDAVERGPVRVSGHESFEEKGPYEFYKMCATQHKDLPIQMPVCPIGLPRRLALLSELDSVQEKNDSARAMGTSTLGRVLLTERQPNGFLSPRIRHAGCGGEVAENWWDQRKIRCSVWAHHQ